VIDFYGPDKKKLFFEDLFEWIFEGEAYTEYIVDKEGVYYICVRNNDSDMYGANTGYDLRVAYPEGTLPGLINGYITDEYGNPLNDIVVKTDAGRSCISNKGDYLIDHEFGNYLIRFISPSHCVFNIDRMEYIKKLETTIINIKMEKVKLSDAIKSLQVIAGFSTNMDGYFDDYNQVGLDDTIRILNCLE